MRASHPYEIRFLHHNTDGDKALIVGHNAYTMPTFQMMFTENTEFIFKAMPHKCGARLARKILL